MRAKAQNQLFYFKRTLVYAAIEVLLLRAQLIA
jgi:hypothetical protein